MHVCLQLSGQLLQNSSVNPLDVETKCFSSHHLARERLLQTLPLTAPPLCYLKRSDQDQDLQLQ